MNDTLKKKGLTPKLRFPEFKDAAGWTTAPLGDLVKTVTPPKKLQTVEYQSTGIFPIIDQSQSSIAGWTNDKAAVVYTTTPLIVFGDHTCVIKRITLPFAQGADGIKILKATKDIDADFLYQALTHRPLMMEEYKRHFANLCDRVVAFPDTSFGGKAEIAEREQRKIAECLQSLDELIAAETEKLEALKRHKVSLMQQIFPGPDKVEA